MRALPLLVLSTLLAGCSDGDVPGGDAGSDTGGAADAAVALPEPGAAVGFDNLDDGADGAPAPDAGSEPAGDLDSGASDPGRPDGEVGDAPEPESEPEPEPVPEPVPCVPACGDHACGPDGCGGLCGKCGDGEICSAAGTCEPDPLAGCGGLELAESWKGEFEGDIVFTALSLLPIEASTHGDMTFSITCFNSKFIVNGTMSGEASDNPFSLTMTGTYNPTTSELKTKLTGGHVTLFTVLEYDFEGEANGVLGPDGHFAGPWNVAAVGGKLLGGPLDLTTFTFSGEGTWEAWP